MPSSMHYCVGAALVPALGGGGGMAPGYLSLRASHCVSRHVRGKHEYGRWDEVAGGYKTLPYSFGGSTGRYGFASMARPVYSSVGNSLLNSARDAIFCLVSSSCP